MILLRKSSRYDLAHNKLRKFVFNNANFIFKKGAQAREIDRIVNLLWERCQRDIAEKVHKYNPETKIIDLETKGKAIVLNMPFPINNLEAYYVAITCNYNGDIRYFVLENGEYAACMCEWKKNGLHVNYGFSNNYDKDDFIQFVTKEFLQEDTVPDALSCF